MHTQICKGQRNPGKGLDTISQQVVTQGDQKDNLVKEELLECTAKASSYAGLVSGGHKA